MAVSEPLVPIDDEALRQVIWSVSTFEEGGSWQENEHERRLEQSASWDDTSRRLLSEMRARRDQRRHEYAEQLALLRRHSDDPRVHEYFATELKSEDHLKRREAVRTLGRLERRDWVIAALTDVAQNDPYEARRSTSSVDYTDPDVAEMHMETYYELREEAQAALLRLR